jgi:hypothetical protein
VRVSTYDQIAWLPLCAGLTGLGLVLSYLAMRRRGVGAGLRGVAWSLLPLAAYLTGSIEMFWKMGVAVGDFAKGFVFSPKVWSGIAVAGLALVLFVVSGTVRQRRVNQGKEKRAAGTGAGAGAVPQNRAPASSGASSGASGGQLATRSTATVPASASPAQAPAKARKGKSAADDDDDMKDIEDILRRHGIT